MIPRPRRGLALLTAPNLLLLSLLSATGATADEDALRASLERDQAMLIELIRRPRTDEPDDLADDPILREIAQRMPRTQDALRRGPRSPDQGR
jgi:hypothetical protein